MKRAKTIANELNISIFHIENTVEKILEKTDPEYIKGKEASKEYRTI